MAARRKLVKNAKRLVIKIGTAVLASPAQGLNHKRIEKIVDEIVALCQEGREVILVTSGAIGAGMKALGLKEKPRTLPAKQAAAAIGQTHLMHLYERLFREKGHLVAQILLTQDDLTHRKRYLNASHTLTELLRRGVIPIINENDSVGVEEIKFGENDNLSALVTNLIQADLLVILSDVDGLHKLDSGKKKLGELIPLVDKIDADIEALAGGAGEVSSTGGMYTKIQAAKTVTSSGIAVVIANGKNSSILKQIFAGEEIGTFFSPRAEKAGSRKKWIAFTCRRSGKIFVDAGAGEALTAKGKSLLPSGIIKAEGDFKKGDMVGVIDSQGKEIVRGLSNYTAKELQKIKGAKTKEIENILGSKDYDEVIHRDNLLVL